MNKKWLSVKPKRQTKPKTKQKWKSMKKGGNMLTEIVYNNPYTTAALVASIVATSPFVINAIKNVFTTMPSIKADGMTYVDNMLIEVLNNLGTNLGNPSEIIRIKDKLCTTLTRNTEDTIKSNIELNDYIFLMGVPARILGHFDTNRKQLLLDSNFYGLFSSQSSAKPLLMTVNIDTINISKELVIRSHNGPDVFFDKKAIGFVDKNILFSSYINAFRNFDKLIKLLTDSTKKKTCDNMFTLKYNVSSFPLDEDDDLNAAYFIVSRLLKNTIFIPTIKKAFFQSHKKVSYNLFFLMESLINFEDNVRFYFDNQILSVNVKVDFDVIFPNTTTTTKVGPFFLVYHLIHQPNTFSPPPKSNITPSDNATMTTLMSFLKGNPSGNQLDFNKDRMLYHCESFSFDPCPNINSIRKDFLKALDENSPKNLLTAKNRNEIIDNSPKELTLSAVTDATSKMVEVLDALKKLENSSDPNDKKKYDDITNELLSQQNSQLNRAGTQRLLLELTSSKPTLNYNNVMKNVFPIINRSNSRRSSSYLPFHHYRHVNGGTKVKKGTNIKGTNIKGTNKKGTNKKGTNKENKLHKQNMIKKNKNANKN